MDEELERFKRLKLHEYAASLGYELDARETSKRETVMRKDGDKISIRMDADGHYVFYSLKGAHLVLQTRSQVLDGRLEATFQKWYPAFRPEPQQKAA